MWNSDPWLKILLGWTALPMIVVWLPLIRGLMDGASYEWGASWYWIQFAGAGVGGDYWVLPLLAVFCLTLLWLGWRGARQPFHWLLLLWNVPAAIEAIEQAVRYPERYRFHGDTLGVDVSLAWVGPLFWGGLALLSLAWVAHDFRAGQPRTRPAWSKLNRWLLGVALGLLPLQFVLLHFGTAHGTTDQIGVVLTMLQWGLLNIGLAPWRTSGGVHQTGNQPEYDKQKNWQTSN